MKIFQINSTCGYGSTGRIAVDILKEVEKNGGEGIIAYGRNDAPQGINSYKITTETDVKIHGVLSRITDRQGFYSTSATKKLIEKIKEYNPDIIHLHNVHGYYLNVKTLFEFLKEYNKPIVWTLHDCWTFTGHCAYFSFYGCEKWKTECNSCPLKKDYPSSLVLDNSKKNFIEKKELFTSLNNVTFVTPSVWLADLVKESYLKKFNVKVINNGIDLSKFKPTKSDFREKYNLENKQIILGVASVWEERKGLKDFIELNKMLDENQKIVLVGLNDSQLAELPKNIIGIKRTNSIDELAQLYSAADVFVNTTYEDNYPTTNLESISCGTPVITYKTGGSPESVAEGNGFIVEKGDILGVYEALKNVDGCKVETKDTFDASLRYKEYVDLYKELLKA
jgi:glycosyltransferase involved in cell wall biosynthesis